MEVQEGICADWWLLNVSFSPENLTNHLEMIAFYTHLDTKPETHDCVSVLTTSSRVCLSQQSCEDRVAERDKDAGVRLRSFVCQLLISCNEK